ncbi:MAG: AAA family ATPase, partial [bacterium]|nr:AAA family ATPase [Candidatus Limimorpha equi]
MALSKRIYTAGRSDFKMIRERNCIYVDKTELVYDLTHESQYVFLSRPRRFGKTLLCSTLQYYFEGRKELFEGLRMAELETEWKHYPVMRFDISACKNKDDMEGIRRVLCNMLLKYEQLYGKVDTEISPGEKLKGLIERSHEQTGQPAVVIIDEYDSVLLEYLDKPGQLEEVRRILQEFYQTLKICDAH